MTLETPPLETLSLQKCFGGDIGYYRHQSRATRVPMRFTVFTPPQAAAGPVPVLWWLSGLTCTEENFTTKSGAYRKAAELGMMIVVPDTSPRGDFVPGDPQNEYDFGKGAGFYLDATSAPWSGCYRMFSYVALEMPHVIASNFPADMTRQGISGHSMGGHGAITIALKQPGRFGSVSAFAPICAPSQVPWGKKAFRRYLGMNEQKWRKYDSVALIEDGARFPEMLVDQGYADPYRNTQLRPDLLQFACKKAGMQLYMRFHEDYDHSFFFIASFIDDHLAYHAERLFR
jgi:S-formylglutathione hydrolase